MGKFSLKCSYGTSKYCTNFLKEGYCEVYDKEPETGKECTFIHYLERKRDKVI
jgi:hypothetical protein